MSYCGTIISMVHNTGDALVTPTSANESSGSIQKKNNQGNAISFSTWGWEGLQNAMGCSVSGVG